MKIRVFHPSAEQYAGQIVATALLRSFTAAQVVSHADLVSFGDTSPGDAGVWINPPEEAADTLAQILTRGGKALVLGRLGPRVAESLKLELRGPLALPAEWADCQPHEHTHHDESLAGVRYERAHELGRLSPHASRPLCRFDLTHEWNNLGFGRITADGSAWSLQSAILAGSSTPIARLATPDGDELLYAALTESPRGAALWFNRPVGPVDSLEWRVVESFFGDYRPDDLPCFPYLSEVPEPFRGVVCPRLDCDESVVPSGPLVELYRSYGLPLSLALQTRPEIDADDVRFMQALLAGGGSVVSHSVHHYLDWGGTYETAQAEALASRDWFDRQLPEATPVRYAVSPFHQNAPYAVSALADCGYEGFVGGIIANDPEYLFGRAGRAPFSERPIVSLSTQCLLHGDCLGRYGESVDVYVESFARHLAAGSMFGYLDHPFSDRNQYGWESESQRCDVHRRLIERILPQADLWWANLDDVLGFLRQRDAALVEQGAGGTLTVEAASDNPRTPLAILWKGKRFAH